MTNPRTKKKEEMMAVMNVILQEQEDMRKRHDQEVKDMNEKIRTEFLSLARGEFPHVEFLIGEERGTPKFAFKDQFHYATKGWVEEEVSRMVDLYVEVEKKGRSESSSYSPFSMDVALQGACGDVDGDYEW